MYMCRNHPYSYLAESETTDTWDQYGTIAGDRESGNGVCKVL